MTNTDFVFSQSKANMYVTFIFIRFYLIIKRIKGHKINFSSLEQGHYNYINCITDAVVNLMITERAQRS